MKRSFSPLLIFAVSVNFILFFVKLYIGIRTNSLCIYTDAVNNLTDTLSAILALLGMAFLSRPKTEKHPFGFGRLEYITGFIMSLIMTVAGLSFAYSSLERFFAPTPVWYFRKYAIILLVTCTVKFGMGILFRSKYKKDGSPVLKTLTLDSFMDCGVTAVALVSFTLTNKTGLVLDAFLGLLISIMIAVSGIRLIVSSISQLIGSSDGIDTEKIEIIIRGTNENISVQKILVHNYGRQSGVADIYLRYKRGVSIDIGDIQYIIKERLKNELGLDSAIEWEENYEKEKR